MNELAIANPILLADLKPQFADEQIRQYPDAKYPFLRFQIGRKVDRPMMEAVFEGKRLVRETTTGRRVSVFKLLGFGETLEAAKLMAQSKKSKSSPILSTSFPKEQDLGSRS
jgi:hypothetical protein